MARHQSAGKQGVKSGSTMSDTARRGGKPPASTRAVAGAFGKEGIDRQTQGTLKKPGRRRATGRRRKAA